MDRQTDRHRILGGQPRPREEQPLATAALYATAAVLWIAAASSCSGGGPFILNVLDGLAGGAGWHARPDRISNPSVRKELFAHLAPKR